MMLAKMPLDQTRSIFENALLRAITEGQSPHRTAELTEETWSAIDAIAREHPEATVRLISDAFETFERESGYAWLDRYGFDPARGGGRNTLRPSP
ncbi:hypothetical protein EAH80_04295 [Mycobacterium hodleri]|uniref:Uncharacterized protein n=1 Tax=Mycolicibacterium hodleri TaxID=49897 RepID=A0A502EHC0_9MYCO|nr:hypothetical protein EAH80_04295 [Mycolicibacterium hodleri]